MSHQVAKRWLRETVVRGMGWESARHLPERGHMGFRVDLHVHTSRYSACAEAMDPYRLADAAATTGLDGLVLTDHDVLWADEEIEVLRAALAPIHIFRGIEVTAREAHLVVIGMTDAGALHRGIPAVEVIDQAHAAGGVVILAHPFRDSDPAAVARLRVDAVEIASTSFSRDESRRSIDLARSHKLPMVAASDAHALSRVGWAWTELRRPPGDEGELARMLIAGSGRPVAPRWPDLLVPLSRRSRR
jgi:predicted metal-dependent phosphoesterase TrpH